MPDRYFIDSDIVVACTRAASFPEGIGAAYNKLRGILPSPAKRTFYGISRGDRNGDIIYYACAQQLYDREADELGLETFTIRKGEYISEVLEDWRKDEPAIGRVFRSLLLYPDIDAEHGYCVEIYFNEKDVRCMVILQTS